MFAACEEFSCTGRFARIVSDTERLGLPEYSFDEAEFALLCELLNRGHLYLEQL